MKKLIRLIGWNFFILFALFSSRSSVSIGKIDRHTSDHILCIWFGSPVLTAAIALFLYGTKIDILAIAAICFVIHLLFGLLLHYSAKAWNNEDIDVLGAEFSKP